MVAGSSGSQRSRISAVASDTLSVELGATNWMSSTVSALAFVIWMTPSAPVSGYSMGW